jgi:hypothetical protein
MHSLTINWQKRTVMPIITLLTDFGLKDSFIGVMKGIIWSIAPEAQIADLTHAIAGSEDIIDAMDLRAFGVGPRIWLEKLTFRKRDRVLIAFGVAIFLFSLAFSMIGLGKFWVPAFLIH